MNYEKLHKDTINKLQQMVNSGKITVEIARGICADFVPESEDDKIRKALIEMVHDTTGDELWVDYNVHKEDAISWLEKQGEKIDVIGNFDTEFEKQVSCLIASAINKDYEYTKDFVKWAANGLLEYAKHEIENQGEQNSSWSEKDEKILNYLLWFYDTRFRWNDTCSDDIKFGDIVTFLTSLKERYTWRPSDEQIIAVNIAINVLGKGTLNGKQLIALQEQLKKLRDE